MSRLLALVSGWALLCAAAPGQAQSRIERLEELKSICDRGLLTEQECADRRRSIMDGTSGDSATANWYCNYSGDPVDPSSVALTDDQAFSEQASASSIVKEILDVVGLSPNFVVRSAAVPNAAASVRSGERFVEYNPEFIAQLKRGTGTNWGVYSVMAHEIGHHLEGHTVRPGGSRPAIELEADRYSGFVLRKLGATLSQAEAAMRTIGSDTSSGTHPARADRLAAIRKGWESVGPVREQEPEPVPQPTPQPQPIPQPIPPPPPPSSWTDACMINGEALLIAPNGAVHSRQRNMMVVGQKLPPLHPSCLFDLLASQGGRYCVTQNGSVFFGTPVPVGQCQPCTGNLCN